MSKRPIFVLGRNRSGTKWLSNILSNHPDVASLCREGAGGIVEVNELSNPYLFGDLGVIENKMAFLAFFEKTNYFKLSGLSVEELHKVQFDTLHSFFGSFMSMVASANGQLRWLQKSNTLALPGLLASFPEARFILIRRENIVENIQSHIALHWLGKERIGSQKQLFRKVISYVLHWKFLSHFKSNPRVIVTSYEELKIDTELVVRDICEFVELDYVEGLCARVYKPNSSFSGAIKKDEVLTVLDKLKINLYSKLCRMIPYSFYGLATSQIVNRFRSVKGRGLFQPNTFSIWSESKK